MKTHKVVYLVVAAVMSAAAGNLYVECESFRDLGGWIVDPHSMRQIGSVSGFFGLCGGGRCAIMTAFCS